MERVRRLKTIPDQILPGQIIMWDLEIFPDYLNGKSVLRRIFTEVHSVHNEYSRNQPNYSVEFEGQQYGVDHEDVRGWKPAAGQQLTLGFCCA